MSSEPPKTVPSESQASIYRHLAHSSLWGVTLDDRICLHTACTIAWADPCTPFIVCLVACTLWIPQNRPPPTLFHTLGFHQSMWSQIILQTKKLARAVPMSLNTSTYDNTECPEPTLTAFQQYSILNVKCLAIFFSYWERKWNFILVLRGLQTCNNIFNERFVNQILRKSRRKFVFLFSTSTHKILIMLLKCLVT